MKDRKHIVQHFPLEEKDFVEQMIDLCQQVVDTYSYRLTAFLNPAQDEIVKSLAAHFQLSCYSSRSILETEFSRCILAPDYYVFDEADLDMMAFEILYPRKFHQITHSQVLGSLLHQLGIKRQYLGDIRIEEEQVLLILDRKFGQLVMTDVKKIARTPVQWKEIPLADIQLGEDSSYQTKQVLLSSLRLDKVIATAFQLSRTSANQLIEARQVKVDYHPVAQAGKEIAIGQLVSVRGFGRIRVKELLGYSKNGKLKTEIEVIRK